ncbi:hypothetical protein A3Q56_07415 [Intoshia linei]|uniref:DUF659 domain-containing protein n=1 Tax=Intoshia linei TaxID=1819745 RepID=A0A177ASB8_9BILA|nr:hypothetical protein A3Q56_07415 [Intoshia linei]
MQWLICNKTLKFKTLHKHLTSLKNHYRLHDQLEVKSQQHRLIDEQIIAACAEKHILPFSIVEDPLFQWAYPTSCQSRKTLVSRLNDMVNEFKKNIMTQLNSKFVSILLDGWTNPVNKQHHISYIIYTDKFFYWSSLVLTQNSSNIFASLDDVIKILIECKCKILGCVTDNDPRMIKLHEIMSHKYPYILLIRCEAYLFNLLMGDVFKSILMVTHTFKEIQCYRAYYKQSRF